MLRMLVVAGLIVAASAAANAQSIPSATFTQTNVNNYALIAPGAVSTEITVKQTGANNNTVIDQSGEINTADVDQRAKSDNNSFVGQNGGINIAVVTQQYNFGPIAGATPGYSGQQTSLGYLSEFDSGGLSILALTGAGNTLISNFGRTH
jgi:Curlin associated repeat